AYEAAISRTSAGVGARDSTIRNASLARESGVDAVRRTRAASERAASKNASSFSVVSAWSGVFVRTRRTVQRSRLVASNVRKLGYGADRRMKTYSPRRERASPSLRGPFSSLYGRSQMPAGCGG